MVDNNTIMDLGKCIECGAKETDGFSCYEMFQFPLVWEHNDPELYALHFWLVSCYMIPPLTRDNPCFVKLPRVD